MSTTAYTGATAAHGPSEGFNTMQAQRAMIILAALPFKALAVALRSTWTSKHTKFGGSAHNPHTRKEPGIAAHCPSHTATACASEGASSKSVFTHCLPAAKSCTQYDKTRACAAQVLRNSPNCPVARTNRMSKGTNAPGRHCGYSNSAWTHLRTQQHIPQCRPSKLHSATCRSTAAPCAAQ